MPVVFVDTHARDSELVGRLEKRQSTGRDASEADVDVLRYQVASADALTDAEMNLTVRVDTDFDVDADNIVKRINAILP